jgi:hypothetical protein
MTMLNPATQPFVGKVYLEVGNGASPEVFHRYCEVHEISGIGVKNDQIDVTTFCSGGFKQYIPGLSDGSEVSFTANFVMSEVLQEDLMDDVDNKAVRNIRIQVENDSPGYFFELGLAMLSYDFAPSVSKQNTIKFSGKTTGLITRVFGNSVMDAIIDE